MEHYTRHVELTNPNMPTYNHRELLDTEDLFELKAAHRKCISTINHNPQFEPIYYYVKQSLLDLLEIYKRVENVTNISMAGN